MCTCKETVKKPDSKVLDRLSGHRALSSNARSNDILLNPDRYKGEERLLLNIDWLSLRMEETISLEQFSEGLLNQGGFKLEHLPGGAGVWNSRSVVWYNNEKVGILTWDSYLPTLKGSMVIKLENHLFYYESFEFFKWWDMVEEFAQTFGTAVLNISRLDLCLDGVNFDPLVDAIGFNHGVYQIKQKNTVVGHWDISSQRHTSLSVGKKSGARYGRYYNKTQEIKDKGGQKDYINYYHKANGYDPENRDVKRFEIVYKSEFLNDYGIHWQDLWKQEKLLALFKQSLDNFFEFVPLWHTDSRKSRRPRLPLIDWSKWKEIPVLIRIKRKIKDGIRTAKILVKKLIKDAMGFDGVESFYLLRAAGAQVEKYDLWEWLKKRQNYWPDEFKKYAALRGIVPNTLFSQGDYHDLLQTVSTHDV